MEVAQIQKWLRAKPGMWFVVLFLGATSAHVLAVVSFEMAHYRSVHGWQGWNWHDLRMVGLSALVLLGAKLMAKPVHPKEFLFALWAFVTIQWCCLATHELAKHLHLEAFSACVLLVGTAIVYGQFRYLLDKGEAKLAVIEQKESPAVECLVMFLSLTRPAGGAPPLQPFSLQKDGQDTQEWRDWKAEINKMGAGKGFDDPSTLQSFRGMNWMMPLTAIGHQFANGQKRLKKVLIIPSKESAGQFDFFKQTVERLVKPLGVGLDVETMFPKGVDINDCVEISKAVARAKARVKGERLKSYLIDVTGGNVLCSLTAAALTLQEDEAFEYVNTNGYQVWRYDLNLKPRHEILTEP